ncbi:MAG: helix-turn-helix transcriptional regulator [Peptostreptococcaceae bacterium]|nr:helix-turn-helix transcriptional regulator [Peptostreptococcaceae bacterium]
MALDTVIKDKMNLKKIGNKELSEKSGVPLRTINNIVRGITQNPTLDTMSAIAKTLDCILDDFSDAPKEKNKDDYCLTPETVDLAREICDNSELRILLDAARTINPEDLKLISQIVKRMKSEDALK